MNNETQQNSDIHSPVRIADEVANAPSLSVPETGGGEVLPTPQLSFEPYHNDFASFQEDYVRHYIALADTKAAWAFGFVSALFVYFVSTDSIRKVALSPEASAAYISLVCAIVLLIISGFFSFLVIAPRLTSKSGEGIVFFGAVAAKPTASQYAKEISSLDAASLTNARLRHCYDVSTICRDKYEALKKAIWFGLPALALALLASLLID